MDISELLVESETNFDAKNKLNRGNGIVSQSIIDQIESGGITSEMLEAFPFPVFRYRTQITLHGTFLTDKDYFISGGYKNLIVNKNKSLGVRYSAVDIDKKRLIRRILKLEGARFFLNLNSTECAILSYLPLNETNVETMKQVFTSLPQNYIGFSQLYKSVSLWRSYIVIKIVLAAIYEREIYPFLSGLLQKPYTSEIYQTNLKLKQEREAIEQAERDKQYEIEKQEKQAKFQSSLNEFKNKHSIKYIHTFGCGRLLYFDKDYEGRLVIKVLHIFKNKNKMLMSYSETVNNLASIPETDINNSNRKQLKDFRLKEVNERLQNDFYFKLI